MKLYRVKFSHNGSTGVADVLAESFEDAASKVIGKVYWVVTI